MLTFSRIDFYLLKSASEGTCFVMKYLQNLHTHTVHCDGKDTPEEIIEKALELGFDTIGFSRHSYTPYSDMTKKTPEEAATARIEYIKHINKLKTEYSGRIKVYCGYEFDIYSPEPLEDFDYTIGSMHYPIYNGKYLPMDRDWQTVKKIIDEHFGGNGLLYAKNFYENTARIPEIHKFDIVGHFDLLTKHTEKVKLFDDECKEYKAYALEALHAVGEKIKIFEVNTGAISRKNRTTPYPAPFILKEIKNMGCDVIISSDCHNKDFLDCYFDESLEYIRSCGFDRVMIYTGQGFDGLKI